MGSSTPPSTTQTSTFQMSPQQTDLFNTAFPFAKQYASTPIKQYDGSGIAPLSQEEQAAQSQYMGTAVPQTQALATQAAGAQSKMLDPNFMLDPNNNPYLQHAAQSVTDLTTRDFLQKVLPSLRSADTSATGMYSGGSTKAGQAEGIATAQTGQNLSNSLTDMMYRAYQGGLGGMQQAISANPNVQGQQLMPGDIQAAVGGQNRGMEQAKLDELIRKFYTGQELPMLQAQELMALLQGMPGGTTVGTATGSTPQVNPVMAGLGGAASGAAIGSMVMPGIGTGVGAGLGGLAGLLANRRF